MAHIPRKSNQPTAVNRFAPHQPTSDTSEPKITVIKRGIDRYESIICRRSTVQRFWASTADEAEQHALDVVRNFNLHNFNPSEKD